MWVKDLGSNLSKVLLEIEKGLKILLENDTKMTPKCYCTIYRFGKYQPNPWKCENYGSINPLSP
jgi:hypothetical protein